MSYVVEMAYIGGILSENAYKMANRRTRPFVRRWMNELTEKVRRLDVPSASSYIISVTGRFTDERRPDVSNLFKVISDAIQPGLGVNDKFFRMLDNGYSLGFVDPTLIIEIQPQEASIA